MDGLAGGLNLSGSAADGRPPVPKGQGLGIFDSGSLNLLAGMQEQTRAGQMPVPITLGAGAVPQAASAPAAQGNNSKKGKKPKDDDDQNFTTVMLRNIPNKYSRQMLMDEINKTGFVGEVDYMYLPTDFTNRCNVGYCFCNFRTAEARQRFQKAFDGVPAQQCLPGFNSYKVCQVTRAKWQGRSENVKRLRSSPELMQQLAAHPEWLPLLMNAKGDQEPFPCDEEIFSNAGRGGGSKQQRKKKANVVPERPGSVPTAAGFPGLPAANLAQMGLQSPEAFALLSQQMAAASLGFPGFAVPGASGASASFGAPLRGRGSKAFAIKSPGAGRGGGRGGGAKAIPGGLAAHVNPPTAAAKAFAGMPQAFSNMPQMGMLGAMPAMMNEQSMQYMQSMQYDPSSFEASGAYSMTNPYAAADMDPYSYSQTSGGYGPCNYMGGFAGGMGGFASQEGFDEDAEDDEEDEDEAS